MTWLTELAACHEASDRLAVSDSRGDVTGRALMSKATVAADFLAQNIEHAGKPVPALLSTNGDALAMIVGGAAADRPLAPMGPQLAVSELAAMVRGCGNPVLVTESRFLPVAAEVAGQTGSRVHQVPALAQTARPSTGRGGPIAFYLHTAGTTGQPKPVRFTQTVLTARTAVLSSMFGFSPRARYATGSPMHHVGGLGNTIAALSSGSAILPAVRFTLDWWRNLAGTGITHCLLVPAMIEMLITSRLLDTVGLETLIYGGAPITPLTLRRVLTALPSTQLFNLYGQTEGSPIAVLSDEDHRRAAAGEKHLLGSAGRIVTGARARIDRPDAHGVGELWVAGSHLAQPDADNWLRTGDLGRLDDDGYLHLSGRLHDMIVRGGENIFPVEVENVLRRHPAVRDVGVTGVPDSRLGETVAAFVVAADRNARPEVDDLVCAVRAELAAFKVPAVWQFVDELPYNAAGKLQRKALARTVDT